MIGDQTSMLKKNIRILQFKRSFSCHFSLSVKTCNNRIFIAHLLLSAAFRIAINSIYRNALFLLPICRFMVANYYLAFPDL